MYRKGPVPPNLSGLDENPDYTCAWFIFDTLSISVCMTSHMQTSGQLVQELNVCTVLNGNLEAVVFEKQKTKTNITSVTANFSTRGLNSTKFMFGDFVLAGCCRALPLVFGERSCVTEKVTRDWRLNLER